eukprot:scaffold7377_cov389-Prasinococcus_capsulatus_cf.AAC.3
MAWRQGQPMGRTASISFVLASVGQRHQRHRDEEPSLALPEVSCTHLHQPGHERQQGHLRRKHSSHAVLGIQTNDAYQIAENTFHAVAYSPKRVSQFTLRDQVFVFFCSLLFFPPRPALFQNRGTCPLVSLLPVVCRTEVPPHLKGLLACESPHVVGGEQLACPLFALLRATHRAYQHASDLVASSS